MSFAIRPGHVGDDLERLARHAIDRSIEALTASRSDPDSVHEVRKQLKRLRAVLRMLDDGGMAHGLSSDDARLRKAGHLLGPVRDAYVMPQTLSRLAARHRSVIGMATSQRMARAIPEPPATARIRLAVSPLRLSRRHLIRHLRRVRGFKGVRAGVVAGYKACATALADLAEGAGAADFHRLRRRVKTHGYQIRLLRAGGPAVRTRLRRVKTLETWLGDEHNLAVLADELLRHPARFGGLSRVAPVLGCIQIEQLRLRRLALRHAHALFAMHATEFEATINRWWRRAH